MASARLIGKGVTRVKDLPVGDGDAVLLRSFELLPPTFIAGRDWVRSTELAWGLH